MIIKNVYPNAMTSDIGYVIASFPPSKKMGPPHIKDEDTFYRSVILITGKSSSGEYYGIKVNHILTPGVEPEYTIGSQQSYEGGPISTKTGNLLHTSEVIWDRSKQITEDLYSTVMDKATLASEKMPETRFLAFGYVMWQKNQLEYEIEKGLWVSLCRNINEIIFRIPIVNRWLYVYQQLGISPGRMAIDCAIS